ncbi:MAG: GC-type dockerin domain-anchored protein [Phycisphaerales bacterium JB060]
MHRTTATAIATLLTTTTLVHAQARYEIGYQFNCEPPVVFSDDQPFAVETWSPVGWHWVSVRFPDSVEAAADWGMISARVFKMLEPHPEFGVRGWTEVVYDDVVFSSSSDEPIRLGLQFFYASTSMSYGSGSPGSAFRFELSIELDGDTRNGVFEGVTSSPGELERRYMGFLADRQPRHEMVTLSDFTVPVNTPVRMRVRSEGSIAVPAGEGSMNHRFDTIWPGHGFPLNEGIFLLPEGVVASSRGARIRDNRLISCWADYDHDGELTLADALEFQNHFHAGDLAADFDSDGEVTLFDFLEFRNQFDAGCS